MAYAQNTTVSVARTREQIERTLERYGADRFGYLSEPGRVAVVFTAGGRNIRFIVPLPDATDRQFTYTPTGRAREAKPARELFEQAVRQRWRALELIIKAKLEAIESGVATFEEEFLPYTLLPSGDTVFESTYEQVHEAITSGRPITLTLEAGHRA